MKKKWKKNIQHSYSKEIVFLEDYAFLINALNDLSDKTMNFKYKDYAKNYVMKHFQNFMLKKRIYFKKIKKIIMIFFLIQLILVTILFQTEMQ